MNKFDYLIVGAGLFGAVFGYEASKHGKKCLVIDKRNHIGGNVYTDTVEDITVHRYGAHIFHTKNERVWNYVNQFAAFNHFVNSPVAFWHDEAYNLPFNMNTFSQMWGIKTPAEAKAEIAKQIEAANIGVPRNLEEQAIVMVGRDIYLKLIKDYTEKQWGRPCNELPPFIIKRLPVRFTYDNNYFNEPFQGIPVGGYTQIIEKLLSSCTVELNCDFIERKEELAGVAERILYTGALDELFAYRLGKLEYRSLQFETQVLDADNFQGNAVINYTSHDVAYTRIIEHKHFEFGTQPKTVITKEYPKVWQVGDEPFYPINNAANNILAEKYATIAKEAGYLFGGRLADYRYYDMDKIVENALKLAEAIL